MTFPSTPTTPGTSGISTSGGMSTPPKPRQPGGVTNPPSSGSVQTSGWPAQTFPQNGVLPQSQNTAPTLLSPPGLQRLMTDNPLLAQLLRQRGGF